ncbi:MAG: hypothetical protein ACFFKA_12210, partial [Candidatus Thorarchaeota archaeon]
MALNHPSGINLNNYYNANLGYVAPCARNSHVRWYSSCYDVQETIYYFIKFLALPLAASFIFFIIFYLGFYNIPELQLISSILTFIAVLFLTTYIRERVRARIFRIRNGLIDVYDPSNPLMNFTLNNISQAKFTIGFVGDIMMMRGHDLRFDPEVIDFFKVVDIIVGNLEGIVTPTGGHTLVTQAHCPDILIELSKLLTGNTKWLLCLNNNHSIDFGNIEFHNSLNLINGQGLLVYGRNDAKNVLVNGLGINIATTSRWSNKGTWDCISRHWYTNENGGNGISAIHRNINLNLL